LIGQPPSRSLSRGVVFGIVAVVGLLIGGVLVAPILIFAGGGFNSLSGSACGAASGQGSQPDPSASARNSIPANYLQVFKTVGARTGVPWVILAGIGKVESDDGQTNLPGVHSGANPFGAAGPMQIGIGGASTNTWGGAPIHPASQNDGGVASDGDGDGIDNVYDPWDAVTGAARYLLEHGVLDNPQQAIFAYNHLTSYVQTVLSFASVYSSGGFTVTGATLDAAPQCLPGTTQAPNSVVTTAIAFAEQQLGKPYLWGGTGPDAFDCSGLVMAAYRAAGVDLPRTSQVQWTWGPRIPASQVEPGDLVFFAGSDGTTTSPGHVGIVIGGGKMIEAFATGFPIRIAPYGGRDPVGFTRPWQHSGVNLAALMNGQGG
jgi:cell wall-associated NlpC family hydrolase